MPEIALGNIPISRVVKTHITACGVDKTVLNNHPIHVSCDTRPQACDTGPVDLEKTCWINTGDKWPESGVLYLLALTLQLIDFIRTYYSEVGFEIESIWLSAPSK